VLTSPRLAQLKFHYFFLCFHLQGCSLGQVMKNAVLAGLLLPWERSVQ
jgi:hypothetical protein